MNDQPNLAHELQQLRAEVAELRAAMAGHAAAPAAVAGAGSDDDSDDGTTRRGLLHALMGAGGAVVLGGAAAVAKATPAAAAGTFSTETVNRVLQPTELRYDETGNGPYNTLLFLQDGVWGQRPTTARSTILTVWSGNWATDGILAVSSSFNGAGIEARGEAVNATGLRVSGRQAAIQFVERDDVLAPPDTFIDHTRGELQYDADGNLWQCVESSSDAVPPGAWRKLAGPATAGAFHLLPAPQRAYSSRDSGEPKVQAGEERVVSLAGVGVPAGATGALLNVTLTETVLAGYVAVLAADAAWAGTSNLNWTTSNLDIANMAVTALDPSAALKVRGGVNATHVIVDVFGYWR